METTAMNLTLTSRERAAATLWAARGAAVCPMAPVQGYVAARDAAVAGIHTSGAGQKPNSTFKQFGIDVHTIHPGSHLRRQPV